MASTLQFRVEGRRVEFAGTSPRVDVVGTVRQQHVRMDDLIYPCLHCNRYTCRCDEAAHHAWFTQA
jgi:hypothetical protein